LPPQLVIIFIKVIIHIIYISRKPFAQHNEVIALDINQEKVDLINNSTFPLEKSNMNLEK
jgi:UDP-glucose 6-dehydrogenase